MSKTSASDSAISSTACFFDSSTCKRQSFSVPEKFIYYIAKNCTNAETFQKLVESCKYFYKVNPVIVTPLLCCYDHEWDAGYDVDGEYGMKSVLPINYKIWVTQKFACVSGNAPQMIPWIYKNDATEVVLQSEPLTFEIFLFLAGNAKELSMYDQMVKYENGERVQFEDIVKHLPKLTSLTFEFVESGVNSNTVKKLMEIEHFKNISLMKLVNVSEALDVEGMFKYIWENRHVSVYLCYRDDISDDYKEHVRKYSNLLRKANVCNSRIRFYGMNYGPLDEHQTPSSEDDSSDTSYENMDIFDDDNSVNSDVEENEELPFPWNNEENEEWELSWDKTE